MANHYIKHSADTILRLSVANNVPEAMQEWHWTFGFYDYQQPNEICGLCGHDRLRYSYEIKNEMTGETLWIGSECIKKFTGIKVYDDKNTLLEGKERMDVVYLRIKREQHEQMKKECRGLFRSFADVLPVREPYNQSQQRLWLNMNRSRDYSGKFIGFEPIDLFWIFEQMRFRNVPYTPSLYRVRLRGNECRQQITAMREDQIQLLDPCLSTGQRRIVKILRETQEVQS